MNNLLERTIKYTEPLVSVVIPTRNRPHLVARAVHSALRQSLHKIEVIVVIDGPDDTTLKVLNQIDDPRLKVSMLPDWLRFRHGKCRGEAFRHGVPSR